MADDAADGCPMCGAALTDVAVAAGRCPSCGLKIEPVPIIDEPAPLSVDDVYRRIEDLAYEHLEPEVCATLAHAIRTIAERTEGETVELLTDARLEGQFGLLAIAPSKVSFVSEEGVEVWSAPVSAIADIRDNSLGRRGLCGITIASKDGAEVNITDVGDLTWAFELVDAIAAQAGIDVDIPLGNDPALSARFAPFLDEQGNTRCPWCAEQIQPEAILCRFCGRAVVDAPGVISPASVAATNGFAIASLVLGILWIYWIGSVLALILGYVALRQIDESRGQESGRGLAIAGVVLGWIGVAILALALLAGLTVLSG